MAELIDKSALIADLSKECPNWKFETMGFLIKGAIDDCISIVKRQPIITEAEIRAKAIEEFAEKLKIFCESAIDKSRSNQMALLAWQITCAEFKNAIDEIAEQLKEE